MIVTNVISDQYGLSLGRYEFKAKLDHYLRNDIGYLNKSIQLCPRYMSQCIAELSLIHSAIVLVKRGEPECF